MRIYVCKQRTGPYAVQFLFTRDGKAPLSPIRSRSTIRRHPVEHDILPYNAVISLLHAYLWQHARVHNSSVGDSILLHSKACVTLRRSVPSPILGTDGTTLFSLPTNPAPWFGGSCAALQDEIDTLATMYLDRPFVPTELTTRVTPYPVRVTVLAQRVLLGLGQTYAMKKHGEARLTESRGSVKGNRPCYSVFPRPNNDGFISIPEHDRTVNRVDDRNITIRFARRDYHVNLSIDKPRIELGRQAHLPHSSALHIQEWMRHADAKCVRDAAAVSVDRLVRTVVISKMIVDYWFTEVEMLASCRSSLIMTIDGD